MLLAIKEVSTSQKATRIRPFRRACLFVLCISLLFLATVHAKPVACNKKCKLNKSCPSRCLEVPIGPKISCIPLEHKRLPHNISNTISVCETPIHKTSTKVPHHRTKNGQRVTKTVNHRQPAATYDTGHPKKQPTPSASKKHRGTSASSTGKPSPKPTKAKPALTITPTAVAGSSVHKSQSPPSFSSYATDTEGPAPTQGLSSIVEVIPTLAPTSSPSSVIEPDSPAHDLPTDYKNTVIPQTPTVPSPSTDDKSVATAAEGSGGNEHKDSSKVVIPAVAGSVFGVVAVCIGLFTFYRLKRKRELSSEREDYEAGLQKHGQNGDFGSLQMEFLPNGVLPPPPPLLDSPRQSRGGKSIYHRSVDSLPRSEASARNFSVSSFDDTLAKFPQPADITSWNFYTIPTVPSEDPAGPAGAINPPVDSDPAPSTSSVPVVPIPVKKKAILVDINELKRHRSLKRAASARVHRRELSDNSHAVHRASEISRSNSNVQLNRSKSDRVVGQRWRKEANIQERWVAFKASHELLPPFTPLTASGTRARASTRRDTQLDTLSQTSDLKVPSSSRMRYSTFGKNHGNKDLPEFGLGNQDAANRTSDDTTTIVNCFDEAGSSTET